VVVLGAIGIQDLRMKPDRRWKLPEFWCFGADAATRSLLHDEHATYTDLGPDHYDTRGGTQHAIRNHIRAPNTLGYHVDLRPAA
jgi:hypothetical protein